ncbi:hypothetical protein L1887_07061 [Cichorium endivia]|nr:hypothetical protein L1887_07061 [Cichorium endivia]
MKDYLEGLYESKDIWRSVKDGPHTDIEGRFIDLDDDEPAGVLNATNLRKVRNDERAMRELRSGLGPDVRHHISGAKSAKEIWDRLAVRFAGDNTLHSTIVQEVLANINNFKQQENETLEQTYERYSNMVYELEKYGETRSQQEVTIKFLYSLRLEWRPIMLMIKSYENINTYSLAALYNLIKSHEPEICGRRSEKAGSISLALMSNVEEEQDKDEPDGYLEGEKGEKSALYAANNRRFRKPFVNKSNPAKPFVKNFNKNSFTPKPKPETYTPK